MTRTCSDGGELDTALAFLSFARSCVLKKVDGLDEEQLRRRLVASGTTLPGLVQHLTDGERYWFGYTLAGDLRYADVDFDMVVAPDEAFALLRVASRGGGMKVHALAAKLVELAAHGGPVKNAVKDTASAQLNRELAGTLARAVAIRANSP